MKKTWKTTGTIAIAFATAFVFALPAALPTATQAAAAPSLNKKSLTLQKGQSKQLKVKNAKGKLTWKTSNKKVAAVSKKGLVKAIKSGKCVISVKAGKKTLKCKITVKNKEKENPVTPTNNTVKWTTSQETFTGAYANQDSTTGQTDIIPKTLTRKYVSFSPWPTTDAHVQYVIKNCDDPYVVAALYIVALDNYKFTSRGNYDHEYYKMLDSLMSGAGTLTGSSYKLGVPAKQQIEEFHNKKVVDSTGAAIACSDFASRAYLKGATPYNNYTPEGGTANKSSWKIVMDEYAYCGDLANGYITVCPQRYTEEQETAGGAKTRMEHWQGIRIGMRYNKTAKVWIPCDNVSLNTAPTGALKPFEVQKQVLFSSNYMAPQADQGF